MRPFEKAIVSLMFMALFVGSLFAWDYWHYANANPPETAVNLKGYAKAHTLVSSQSKSSSLRYRALAHTEVSEAHRR